MSVDALATFTALLMAHVLADFVLQTDAMVRHKRQPMMLLLHGAIVLLTAQAATGQLAAPALLALAGAHMAIDAVKTYGRFDGFRGFVTDQAAHLASLVAIALLVPDLWAAGVWGTQAWCLPLMALLTGLILSTVAGQYAVGLLMRPHSLRVRGSGLRDGGRIIGLLERGLIFLLILLGQPLGVGFLVAAKSVLRFGTATRDQRTAEYVIIGTLASFGWAIAVSYATLGLLALLPALEIAPALH